VVITCWSVKGGVGATTTAVAAALVAARGAPGPVLLVDLAGDVPASLGVAEPTGPGVAEWLTAGAQVPPDSLARLAVPAAEGVELLARGRGPLEADRAAVLLQVLAATRRTVVVDAGNVHHSAVALRFAAESDRSLLVTRTCVVGLQRAAAAPVRASGLVVLRDAGRACSASEVGEVLGVPVAAELAVDPAVGRAVDAGLARARLPRSFLEAVAALAPVAVGS